MVRTPTAASVNPRTSLSPARGGCQGTKVAHQSGSHDRAHRRGAHDDVRGAAPSLRAPRPGLATAGLCALWALWAGDEHLRTLVDLVPDVCDVPLAALAISEGSDDHLNTPRRHVGAARSSRGGPGSDPTRRRILDTAHRSTRRMTRVVDGLPRLRADAAGGRQQLLVRAGDAGLTRPQAGAATQVAATPIRPERNASTNSAWSRRTRSA